MTPHPIRLVTAAWLALACSTAHAAGQTVQVAEADPGHGAVLAMDDTLSVRLTYESETPLRFQASGYRAGSEVTSGARMNPAPPYPTGSGEAIAWIAYAEPAEIDELRIEVWDDRWRPLRTVRLPFRARWHTGATLHARPAWVSRLNGIQQQMTSAPPPDEGDGSFLMMALPLAMLTIPGYFVLQIFMWRRWKGVWRTLSLAPLLVTVPVTLHALFALAGGSNLWPLLMIFTLPFAFTYLAAVGMVKRVFGS